MADKSTFASSLSQSKHRSKRMLEFTCATANIEPFGIVKITSASTLLDEAGLVMTVVPATLSTDTDTGDASDTLIFGVNGPVRVRKNTVGTLSLDFPTVIAYDTENKDAPVFGDVWGVVADGQKLVYEKANQPDAGTDADPVDDPELLASYIALGVNYTDTINRGWFLEVRSGCRVSANDPSNYLENQLSYHVEEGTYDPGKDLPISTETVTSVLSEEEVPEDGTGDEDLLSNQEAPKGALFPDGTEKILSFIDASRIPTTNEDDYDNGEYALIIRNGIWMWMPINHCTRGNTDASM